MTSFNPLLRKVTGYLEDTSPLMSGHRLETCATLFLLTGAA